MPSKPERTQTAWVFVFGHSDCSFTDGLCSFFSHFQKMKIISTHLLQVGILRIKPAFSSYKDTFTRL